MGTFTLDEWLGTSKGMAAFYVTLLALAAFWGVHKYETHGTGRSERFSPAGRGAVALALAASLGLLIVPQPGLEERIERMAPELDPLIAARDVQIDPAELVELMHNNQVRLVLIDVRSEADFNVFHLLDAEHVTLDELRGDFPKTIDPISIVVTMSNDEGRATEAFRILRAQGLPGTYVLAGGINGWLEVYGGIADIQPRPVETVAGSEEEPMRFTFPAALGDRVDISWPDPHEMKLPEREFRKKAKSRKPMALAGGGCG
ncbi:MAG TPA: rhodanese-like domain-containing protein [Planctomycetes bacterium]|nr:rhodanese-like domain-containing protein [Planctomycetota bacterium]